MVLKSTGMTEQDTSQLFLERLYQHPIQFGQKRELIKMPFSGMIECTLFCTLLLTIQSEKNLKKD